MRSKIESEQNDRVAKEIGSAEENDPKGKELVGSQRMSRPSLSHHKMD